MDRNKKIAIIARTIFPSQSPRSARATNLAIALRGAGYDVTLFSLLGQYDYKEFEKENNLNLINLGNSLLGNGNSDTGKKSSHLIYKLFRKILGKLILFPEIELVYFIWRKRREILKNDIVITISAPYTIHFGMNLIYNQRVRWISDCGDPFMGNPINKPLFYFQYFENSWARNTNFITIPTIKAIDAYPKKYHHKIKIIPQGFSIIRNLEVNYVKNKIPHFCYSGIVYERERDPTLFLEFLSKLEMDFRFYVYTKTPTIFNRFKIELGEKLIVKPYIPREELLVVLSKMDFLLNIKNNSKVQVPSKLIDYYMTRRPILHISTAFGDSEREETVKYLSFNFREDRYPLEDFDIQTVTRQFINLM